MPSSSQKPDLPSSLSKLSIDSSNKKPAAKKIKEPVADSWEDEDVDDEEEGGNDDDKGEREGTATPQADGSKAPPPTPISPTYSAADRSFSPYAAADPSAPSASSSPAASSGSSGARRPEKTDAVARRMIASALGVKVPRMTEEQRAYDRAVKEKERKRREEEKAADKRRLEAAEKAKAAIWED
ncbi:hypothetical protein CGRA01v4_02974 [Colletotrichum graminicola]|uniref:Ubiquitin-like protein smt3 n=1 Tax=Colletotrichum graminicola (strain M1.001 / M2 / FGSC 10212) TaxID=645133 RepID=E3Q9V5_COLGM|nr:uncharacterized protein GLRG_02787 [Colletotrichum graminicola M1.001]EFQ27643.1 hypothetical protein GLRG_02787 [Colletotrichum graminicola M1.001]WDK11695.1 hypothetical protein CGRA01v4_02974 [Colletotrichum graminicola]